jgi:hypothetical protein
MDKAPQIEPLDPGPEQLEPELYSEPARMTAKDIAGVCIALVALAIIGYTGYVWLNPDLNWRQPFPGAPRGSEQPTAAAVTASSNEIKSRSTETPAPAAVATAPPPPMAPVSAEADFTCAQCGMDASRSRSHVIAHWSDGASGHFDSWDCVFAYAKAQGLALTTADVRQFDNPAEDAPLLDALQASYLYDTTGKIDGSMPPYVAAYSGQAAAQAAQKEMGGEVIDFAGLKAKWK